MHTENSPIPKQLSFWPFEFKDQTGAVSSFSADGFKRPVTGIVYEGGTTDSGVPLGGLGTGYLELRTDGKLGRCSMFNDICPPQALDVPFLAVSAGKELRLLCLDSPKSLKGSERILYWGHFPVADLQYQLDLPIRISLRAFTPFILGDAEKSNTPAALFEIQLTNTGSQRLSGWVAFSFPGPKVEPEKGSFSREIVTDPWLGIAVRQKQGSGYALVTSATGEVLTGGYLGLDSEAWMGVTAGKIPTAADTPGVTVAASYEIEPGESQRLCFALVWYYPYFRDSSGEPHLHAYKQRFNGPEDVAKLVVGGWEELQSRTLAWQEVIFAQDLPAWLKNALVNGLY
ncbi:MAG: hypothetical protein KAT86_03665, partial [Candidatus Latescibacteria bacterium]|nr:hypothetical protein [Candidatus Latescibacterota bacterium]